MSGIFGFNTKTVAAYFSVGVCFVCRWRASSLAYGTLLIISLRLE